MRRDLSRPLEEVDFPVGPEDEGARLDVWIASRVTWRSRADLQKRILDGRILLDGRPGRKGERLRAGQVVRVFVDEGPALDEVPVERLPLDVIFEDEHLVVIDKRAGTVVHPVGRRVNDTLINALALRYRLEAGDAEPIQPMIVHRLDQDTSGVLVFAKTIEARRVLGLDFEERRVEKVYLALVEGEPANDAGTIDAPIGPDLHSEIKIKVACVPGGKASRTDFEVLSRKGFTSLVRCMPKTGRQHQIRVHLAHLGHPILCDRLYGRPDPVTIADLDPRSKEGEHVLLARQALHAERLTITHPITGDEHTFTSELPDDLAFFVA